METCNNIPINWPCSNFLSEIHELFDEFYKMEYVEDEVRTFIYRQVLECFVDEVDPSSVGWDEIKPWAIKVFQAFRIPPNAPNPIQCNDRMIYNYCARFNYSDNPAVIDAFRSIGVNPIFAKRGKGCLLHAAALADCECVLKKAIELYDKIGVDVDWKDEENRSTFFLKITDKDTKNNKDTREMLEDLLNAGADPLSTAEGHVTCLHHAIANGQQVNTLTDCRELKQL